MRTFNPITGEPPLDEPAVDDRIERKKAEIINDLEKGSWNDYRGNLWFPQDACDELDELEVREISGVISALYAANNAAVIEPEMYRRAAHKLIVLYKPAIDRMAEQLAKSWINDMANDV